MSIELENQVYELLQRVEKLEAEVASLKKSSKPSLRDRRKAIELAVGTRDRWQDLISRASAVGDKELVKYFEKQMERDPRYNDD